MKHICFYGRPYRFGLNLCRIRHVFENCIIAFVGRIFASTRYIL